jgi:uncharacterized cupredoxin-like copper-binding protein
MMMETWTFWLEVFQRVKGGFMTAIISNLEDTAGHPLLHVVGNHNHLECDFNVNFQVSTNAHVSGSSSVSMV